MCAVSEMLAFKIPAVTRPTSSSGPPVKFHLLLSGGSEAAAPGFARIGVTLSERAKAVLLD